MLKFGCAIQHNENVYDCSVMILLEKNVFKYYGVYTRPCLVFFVVRSLYASLFHKQGNGQMYFSRLYNIS